MNPKIRIHKLPAALLAALVATSIPVRAATLTWDHDANGTASDGAGTWLNANQWLDSVTPATWNNTTPDNAIIGSGGAGGTITLGAVTAGTVSINNFTGTYTLSGGSLAQSGGITIGTTAGSVTISTPVSGTGGLAMSSGGTLTLSAANSFSGGITVSGSTLTASADSSLGTTSGGLTFNGTCTFSCGGTFIDVGRTFTVSAGTNLTYNTSGHTIRGPVVGSGTLTVLNPSQGNPNLAMTSTANTFTGAMNLTDKGASGTAAYYFNSLGDAEGAGIISLGFNAANDAQGSAFVWHTGAVAPLVLNHRQFNIGGSASFIVSNNATPSNTITINTALLATGNRNRTLGLDGPNTGDNTIAGSIPDGESGSVLSLTKFGVGKWILSGANTYTGNTTVNTGTLALVGGSQTSAITVNSGAKLGFAVGSPTTSTKAVTLNTGHKIVVTGTPNGTSDYLLMTASSITGTPVLDSPVGGYTLEVQGSGTQLVLVAPPPTTTLVIDLGAGTQIPGGAFGTFGATNLPLPALPVGSILRSVSVDAAITATDNDNFASDLAILFDPSPGTPGGDFTLRISSGAIAFGSLNLLAWSGGASGPPAPLVDTKNASDWSAAGEIDLATYGIFLGNAYKKPGWISPQGGTWSGTITLTYDLVGTGSPFDTWAAAAGLDGTPGKENGKADDPDGDGRNNNYEFAFNGDPLDGSDNGMVAGLVQDASAPAGNELTLVVAVRDGVTFTGSGTPVVQSNTTPVDGLTYTIEGSLDLASFPGSAVSHVGGPSATAPVATGLPDLTGTDWKYHTFKLDASEGLGSKGFLRAKVE
jgi:fibronectin-binding autotransporter adhesin